MTKNLKSAMIAALGMALGNSALAWAKNKLS